MRGGFEVSSSIIPGRAEGDEGETSHEMTSFKKKLPQVEQNHLRCEIEGRNMSTSEKTYKNIWATVNI